MAQFKRIHRWIRDSLVSGFRLCHLEMHGRVASLRAEQTNKRTTTTEFANVTCPTFDMFSPLLLSRKQPRERLRMMRAGRLRGGELLFIATVSLSARGLWGGLDSACSINPHACTYTGIWITPHAEIRRVRLSEPRSAPGWQEVTINKELFISNGSADGLGAPVVATSFNIFRKAHLTALVSWLKGFSPMMKQSVVSDVHF